MLPMPPIDAHRRPRRRIRIAAVTASLLATTALGPLGNSAAYAAPSVQTTHPGRSSAVTLITGDVVTVTDTGSGQEATDIRRPKGATGGVHAETIGKDLYVLPDEALPYLAANELDRRLFDVTALIKQGYDDGHSVGIPLIVSYGAASSAAGTALTGTTKIRDLPSVHGSAVNAAKKHVRLVWEAVAPKRDATPSRTAAGAQAATNAVPLLAGGISKIWLDGKVHADLSQSTAQIGAPAAWAAGLDGSGVKVAVLDTGVDFNHPDLAGRVSTSQSFVPGESVQDGNGHGTHTASTVAGSGAASGGLEKGVAPKADLIIGKVLGDDGTGDDSWIIAGMQWASAQGARVVSMSLGGDQPSDGTDPLSTAVDALTAQNGTLFVIAAGNAGAEGAISAPGAADAALTVAAVDSSDTLAYFSSMGPRFGDYSLKPDIAAPGVDILAAKAGGTAATGYYTTMSGTSMATPHVAGAAVLLAEEHPGWKAADLKAALMSSSKELGGYTPYQVGAGRVDLAAGIVDPVTATGSDYFGFEGYPQPTTLSPVDRTITYTNSSASSETLNLAATGEIGGGPMDVNPTDGLGTPVPGLFTLSSNTVVVPAHGSVSVTATAHPALGTAGHRYLGEVTAISADGSVHDHTELGFYIEDQRYNMTLSVKDRSGQYVATTLVLQKFGEIDATYIQSSDTGPTTLRLLPGTYSMYAYVNVPGSHGPDSQGVVLLGDPQIDLSTDRTVTLDATQAREITATAPTPKPTEDRVLMMDWYRSDGAGSVISDQYILPATVDTMYALPTKPVTQGSFEYETRWRKASPLLTITDRGKDLTFLGQPGSSLYRGDKQVDAVYLNTGTPQDYAAQNVKGKVVIVTRSDAFTGSQRAQAALAAGAEMLIVVNDAPGKLLDWVGNDDGSNVGLTVVSVTSTVGAALVDRARGGRLRLDLKGTPDSPFVYDLVDPHPGRIPANLAYRPQPEQLATVAMRFHGDTALAGAEFRADYRPYRSYSVGLDLTQDMPSTRTDYVSAQPGVSWSESAIGGSALELVSVSQTHAYRADTRTTVDFFGPVTRPRNMPPFWSSFRDAGGQISFNVQPWADGGTGHAGYMQSGDHLVFTVLQDGVQVAQTTGYASATIVANPPGVTHFNLDLQASRDPSVYRLSPSTHTVWDVMSSPPKDPTVLDTMPLLQLDYGVATDMNGDAAGGRQQLEITASHLAGAVGTGSIQGATLAVSFDDGKTWENVPLIRADGSWTAQFDAPVSGFVSLRTTAWDSVGNRISQQITRAYGLRDPHTWPKL